MSALAPCGACGVGDHENHIEHWLKAPEGVLGGAHCACPGDCKPPAIFDTIFDGVRQVSTDPTAEHIDAVARVVADHDAPDLDMWPRAGGRRIAEDVIGSTDPAVHAALAPSLPAEVMLAALVDRGTLTVEDGYTGHYAQGDPSTPIRQSIMRTYRGSQLIRGDVVAPLDEYGCEVAP